MKIRNIIKCFAVIYLASLPLNSIAGSVITLPPPSDEPIESSTPVPTTIQDTKILDGSKQLKETISVSKYLTTNKMLDDTTLVNWAPKGISVLFLYSPEAVAKMGSLDAVRTRLVTMINKANQVFANSYLNGRILNAYLQPLPLNSDGTAISGSHQVASGALIRIANHEGVIFLRNKYYADFTVLVTTRKDLGNGYSIDGRGFIPGVRGNPDSYNTSTAKSAFSEIAIESNDLQVLIHEMGHNMALRHGKDDFGGVYEYAYGFGSKGAFTTAMQYPHVFATSRKIDFFSTPQIAYNGVLIGSSSINARQALLNIESTYIRFSDECFLKVSTKTLAECYPNTERTGYILVTYNPYPGIFPKLGMEDFQR